MHVAGDLLVTAQAMEGLGLGQPGGLAVVLRGG